MLSMSKQKANNNACEFLSISFKRKDASLEHQITEFKSTNNKKNLKISICPDPNYLNENAGYRDCPEAIRGYKKLPRDHSICWAVHTNSAENATSNNCPYHHCLYIKTQKK